jgi:hypothetical protein
MSDHSSPDSGRAKRSNALRSGRLFAFLALALAHFGTASAEIIVSPLRQVLTRQDPVAVYEISNASDRIIDARVSWSDLTAIENGYAPATAESRAKLSAAPYLVVGPAQFRLEPGKRTKVTVRLKKGAALPPGERRSHLLIETKPLRTPLRRAGGGLEVDVGLGVSTPVILRNGFAPPAVSFAQTKLVRDSEGMLEIETALSREGKYSSFGRLVATMKSGETIEKLAEIDNVAVYSDAPLRRLTVPLNVGALPGGVLTLRYVGAAEFDGRDFAVKNYEIAPPSAKSPQ